MAEWNQGGKGISTIVDPVTTGEYRQSIGPQPPCMP